MAIRFTAKNCRILSLLGKGKTFDDLFLYEPVISDYYTQEEDKLMEDIIDRLKKEGSNRSLTPTERSFSEKMYQAKMQYNSDLSHYSRTVNHIAVQGKLEQIYQEFVQKDSLFESNMNTMCQYVRPNAYYIPNVTFGTIVKSKKVLFNKLHDLITDLPTESGLLFLEAMSTGKMSYTAAYQLTSNGISGFTMASIQDLDPRILALQYFHLNFTDLQALDTLSMDSNEGLVISMLLFIHFFETEKVVAVQPVSNARSSARVELNGEKYDSELNYPINVIDAHWYTTIIRDDPFLVKGHFRKQPYGPGRSQYKVRWITGYMKKGYHRTAKQPNHKASDNLLSILDSKSEKI